MIPNVTARALLVLVAAAGAAAAEEPWIPLAEGKRWEYRLVARTRVEGMLETSREGKMTAAVRGKETVEGREWFLLAWRDDTGKVDATHWVRSDAGGVEVARTSADHLLVVPAVVEPGRAQPEVAVRLGEATLALREVTVGEPEQVVTPFGEREAVPVASRAQAAGTTITTRVWYARGVGPIKVVERLEAQGAWIERELLLVSIDGAGARVAPEVEREDPPARPAPVAGPAPPALVERARALVGGDESRWAGLEAAAKAAHAAAVAAQPAIPAELPWARAETRTRAAPAAGANVSRQRLTVAGGLACSGNIVRSIVVVEGPLSVMGNIKDSLVVVLGDLELTGNLVDSLLLVTGRVSLTGNVGSSAVAGASLQGTGNLRESLLQYGELQVMGAIKENAVSGALPGGKDNRRVEVDLWGHFAE